MALLETLALIGGAGAILGLVAGGVLGFGAKVAFPLGVLVAIGVLAVLYLSAPSDGPHDCSDCYESLGRWWLPRLAVVFSVLNFLGWVGGFYAGRALRQKTP